MAQSPQVLIRAATEKDLPQIHAMFTHYVETTVITFLVHAPPFHYVANRFRSVNEQNLPYLVAIKTPGSEGEEECVVGYCYAAGFRGFMLGYGHSVEMTIFVHPDYQGKGVGNLLMERLLGELKGRVHYCSEEPGEGKQKVIVQRTVRQLLAIMAVDEEEETLVREGNKKKTLQDWYQQWGFEQAGRLKGVGYKLGKV